MENTYFEIRSRYLAESLAFLGFKYQKYGYDRDTRYSFKDSKLIHSTISRLLSMKKELNLV